MYFSAQVSDELKAQVSEEAKKEAARLGKEALARRLQVCMYVGRSTIGRYGLKGVSYDGLPT